MPEIIQYTLEIDGVAVDHEGALLVTIPIYVGAVDRNSMQRRVWWRSFGEIGPTCRKISSTEVQVDPSLVVSHGDESFRIDCYS